MEEFLEKASEGAEVMEVLFPLPRPRDALAVRLLMMPWAALDTVAPLVPLPVGVNGEAEEEEAPTTLANAPNTALVAGRSMAVVFAPPPPALLLLLVKAAATRDRACRAASVAPAGGAVPHARDCADRALSPMDAALMEEEVEKGEEEEEALLREAKMAVEALAAKPKADTAVLCPEVEQRGEERGAGFEELYPAPTL